MIILNIGLETSIKAKSRFHGCHHTYKSIRAKSRYHFPATLTTVSGLV